jgi:transposase-like protein
MGYELALKQTAVRLYLEGTSLRAIGRQLGVHHQSVANWVNAHHDIQLPHHVEDTTPAETIEIDELYTYVGKKSVRRT